MENKFDRVVSYLKTLYDGEKFVPSDEDIESCKKTLEQMHEINMRVTHGQNELTSSQESRECREVYKHVQEALEAANKVIEALEKADRSLILQTGLSLIMISAGNSKITSGYEEIELTISQILLSVFHGSKVNGESLPSKLRSILREECENFPLALSTSEKLYGCIAIGHTLIDELILFQQEYNLTPFCEYKEFDTNRLDIFINILGQLKFSAESIFSSLAQESLLNDNASAASATEIISLSAFGAYANLAGCYIMILSWHLALSNLMKYSSALLAMKYQNAIAEAKSTLEFFADKDLLGPAGWWLGKLRVMKEFRENPRCCASIENIRIFLGLQSTTYSSDMAGAALTRCLTSQRSELNPTLNFKTGLLNLGDRAFDRNDSHYLHLVNQTPYRAAMYWGIVAANNITPVDRIVDSNDEVVIQAANFFNGAGMLAIGTDVYGTSDAAAIDLKFPEKLKDVQFIEFGFSCGRYSGKKMFTNVVDVFSKDHLRESHSGSIMQMGKGDDVGCFKYHGQIFMVQSKIKRGIDYEKKHDFALYQICIEKFDVNKLKERTKEWTI